MTVSGLMVEKSMYRTARLLAARTVPKYPMNPIRDTCHYLQPKLVVLSAGASLSLRPAAMPVMCRAKRGTARDHFHRPFTFASFRGQAGAQETR
jgi:hypothetical protein